MMRLFRDGMQRYERRMEESSGERKEEEVRDGKGTYTDNTAILDVSVHFSSVLRDGGNI